MEPLFFCKNELPEAEGYGILNKVSHILQIEGRVRKNVSLPYSILFYRTAVPGV